MTEGVVVVWAVARPECPPSFPPGILPEFPTCFGKPRRNYSSMQGACLTLRRPRAWAPPPVPLPHWQRRLWMRSVLQAPPPRSKLRYGGAFAPNCSGLRSFRRRRETTAGKQANAWPGWHGAGISPELSKNRKFSRAAAQGGAVKTKFFPMDPRCLPVATVHPVLPNGQ
eukprot:gene9583-biopygen6210